MASERESNLLCEYCGGKMATSDRFCAGCGHANPGFVAPLSSGGSVNAEHLISTQERIKYDEYKLEEAESLLELLHKHQEDCRDGIYQILDRLGDNLRGANKLLAPALDQARTALSTFSKLQAQMQKWKCKSLKEVEAYAGCLGCTCTGSISFFGASILSVIILSDKEEAGFALACVIAGIPCALWYFFYMLPRATVASDARANNKLVEESLEELERLKSELKSNVDDSCAIPLKFLQDGLTDCQTFKDKAQAIKEAVGENSPSLVVRERLPQVLARIDKELTATKKDYKEYSNELEELPEYKTSKLYWKRLENGLRRLAQAKIPEEVAGPNFGG